jgi:hypothetical protein
VIRRIDLVLVAAQIICQAIHVLLQYYEL